MIVNSSNSAATRQTTHLEELPERHELHNVTLRPPAGQRRLQQPVISVEEIHEGKVGTANSDNNEGDGQEGSLDNGVDCRVYVGYHTIGEQEQKEVGLQCTPPIITTL